MKEPKIIVSKNGPYLVSGNLPLAEERIVFDENGDPLKWEEGEAYSPKKSYDLCRCGESKHKPFCDQTHAYVGFDGTETADNKKYLEQAEKIAGPDLDLTDVVELCSSAKFCQRAGGTWELTKNSHDPKSKETAIQQACDCPSGRLVTWNKKTGQAIEPELDPSISLEENTFEGLSGPIRVKGGVSVESADGKEYEIRNRMTLCRCGKSKNKPFCDGVHLDIGFNAKN